MLRPSGAGVALAVSIGLVMALPAMAATPAGRHRQADTTTAQMSGDHPPNAMGLTNLQAMVLDADDMLRLLADLRSITGRIPGQIDAANTTLTNIATLIDGIQARHQQAAPAPVNPGGGTP